MTKAKVLDIGGALGRDKGPRATLPGKARAGKGKGGGRDKEPEPLVPYDRIDGLRKLRELVEERQSLHRAADKLNAGIAEKTAAILVMLQSVKARAVECEGYGLRIKQAKGTRLNEKKLLLAGVSAKVIAKCKVSWKGEEYIEVRALDKDAEQGRRDEATVRVMGKGKGKTA